MHITFSRRFQASFLSLQRFHGLVSPHVTPRVGLPFAENKILNFLSRLSFISVKMPQDFRALPLAFISVVEGFSILYYVFDCLLEISLISSSLHAENARCSITLSSRAFSTTLVSISSRFEIIWMGHFLIVVASRIRICLRKASHWDCFLLLAFVKKEIDFAFSDFLGFFFHQARDGLYLFFARLLVFIFSLYRHRAVKWYFRLVVVLTTLTILILY